MRGGQGPQVPGSPPANLVLIATVHGDPKGYERAWRLLAHLRPELITVEVSPYSVRYRERHQGRWQDLMQKGLKLMPPGAGEHLAIRRLMAQVFMPFEVRAARDFSGRFAVPWVPVDVSAMARRHLPRYAREVLTVENLRALLDGPDGSLPKLVASEFKRARWAARHSWWRPNGLDEESCRRERLLAVRLKSLASLGRRVVHLGGWEHLVPWAEGESLFTRLAGFKPWRVFLDDGDLLL